MREDRIKRNDRSIYGLLIIIESILFILNAIFGDNTLNALLNIIVSVVVLLSSIIKTKKIVTPLNIFSFIWLFIIALTSFEYPLMREMNSLEWSFCLCFIIAFSVGGYLCSFSKIYRKKELFYEKRYSISYLQYWLFLILIAIGVLVHLYQMLRFGGFFIFSNQSIRERQTYSIEGLGSLSTLGSLGIWGIFGDKKYRKKVLFLIFSLLYLFLLFMCGIRFQLFFTTLVCIPFLSYDVKEKKGWVLVLLFLLLLVLFGVVDRIRRSEEEIYYWYIRSGLYSESVDSIISTELFRYFGYGQRLLSYYVERFEAGSFPLAYTLYPIMHTFRLKSVLPTPIWENGYVAVSLIENLYIDFGFLWPLASVIYSFIINRIFYNYVANRSSMVSVYSWGVACFSLSMSFYCYINQYVYAVLYFPIIVWIISYFGFKKGKGVDLSYKKDVL